MISDPAHEAPAVPWSADIGESVWSEAVTALRSCRDAGTTVALACHVDPDGDALGSMLALQLALRAAGWQTVASWGGEPFAVPPQYTFLPGLDTLVPPRDFPERPELLIALDTGSRERLGSLEAVAERAGTVIVIDHHVSNTGFGDIDLVAPRAAATAMLVDELLRRLELPLVHDVAVGLYTGLVTDTGRFQHRSTGPDAMAFGGRLLDQGIPHAEMTRQMFETHSFGYLKLLGHVLGQAVFDERLGLLYSSVNQDDLARWGVALEETESLIDVLRTVDSAETIAVLKELPDGSWRVSLRSKGGVDVGTLAKDLGGGGHAYLAGFTRQGTPDELVDLIRERLV